MIVIQAIQAVIPWFDGMHHWGDGIQLLQWHLPSEVMAIDKVIEQTDLVGDVQKAFNHFVKTGQAWAFLIGLVIGYMLKAFTSFG